MNCPTTTAHRIVIATALILTVLTWHAEALAAKLTLTWTENSTDELGFAIDRSVGTTGAFGEIATTGPSVTTYVDASLADATTYCYRVRAFNGAGYSAYSETACGTTPQVFGLAVLRTGAGSGTVTSVPTGITCGASCSGLFPSGTAVTLTAGAASGSAFTGWSGGGCSGSGTCVLTVSAAVTVTANFAQLIPLTISKAGTGTVTSTPAGINCGPTCSSNFPSGGSVTLSASPAAGFTFTGWSGGGCSGTGTCAVTLSAATTITATFTPQSVALTINKPGPGMGTVTSLPAGINCGSTCTSSFPSGSSVTLSAVATAGSIFSGWSGGGCSGAGTCSVSLAAATAVTATFSLQPSSVMLSVNKAGGGNGTVTSAPSGINCGITCSASYPTGTAVTLTALAGSGSVFTGWSGAGCSGIGACAVTLAAGTTVTTNFTAQSATLTVALLGTGNGTVTSTPSGIACGAICVSTFLSGIPVTLLAAPGPGSSFAGWSGGGCTGTGLCITTVTGATSVNATFNLAPSTSFSDYFQRANSTVLGMGWTEPQGSNFFIQDGRLRNGTEKTRHLAVQSSLTLSAGMVTAKFTSLNNNAAPKFGLVFGLVDAGNYYAAYRQVGGSAMLKIVRVTNGVETVLTQRTCANPVRGLEFDLAVSLSSSQVVLTGAGRTLTVTGISVAPGKVGLMVAGGGTSHAIDAFQAAAP